MLDPEKISAEMIVDMGLEIGLVPHHNFQFLWHQRGKVIFQKMKDLGLRPHHHFLEVGHEGLSVGALVIEYLEDGHYSGAESVEALQKLAAKILQELQNTKSVKLVDGNEWQQFKGHFNFVLFSPTDVIETERALTDALLSLKRILAKDGVLLFSWPLSPRTEGYECFGRLVHRKPLSEQFIKMMSNQLNLTVIQIDKEVR